MSSLSGSAVHIISLLGVDLCKYIENNFAPWYEPMGRHSLHVLLRDDKWKLFEYRLTVARDISHMDLLENIVKYDAPKCLEVALRNLEQYIVAVVNSGQIVEYDDMDDYIRFNLDELEEHMRASFCPSIVDYLWETYETSDNLQWRELGLDILEPQNMYDFSDNMMWRHMITNYLTEEQFNDMVEEELLDLPMEKLRILADVAKELNIYVDTAVVIDAIQSYIFDDVWRIDRAREIWNLWIDRGVEYTQELKQVFMNEFDEEMLYWLECISREEDDEQITDYMNAMIEFSLFIRSQ